MAEVEEDDNRDQQKQEADIQNRIHQDSLFFDSLVNLVPARFYLPNEDTPNPRYYAMSKVAKAAARKATKINLKKARRARYDPENYASTLELVKRNAEKQAQEKPTEENEEAPNLIIPPREDDKSVTYEELRKRLHKRIEELRSKRHATTVDNARNSKNEKRKDTQKGKRKRESEATTIASPEACVTRETPFEKQMKEGVSKTSKDLASNGSTNFEFGRVKLSVGDENIKEKRHKRKESKVKLLERATRLQSTMQDPERGQVVAMEHSWSTAASRAAGVKVLDNPKLLKESMKKKKQQRKKSFKKWKERVELKEKAIETKQQTRAEHITQRNQQKKEQLIAKREKKLLRPGFEGRRDSFINV